MARKTWILDTETKGTGAQVVPLEKAAEQKPAKPRRPPARAPEPAGPPRKRRPPRQVKQTALPLPPGHVRKRSTGEIGKVQAVDPKAGTVTVFWLKRGAPSTVPLSAVTRR